MARFTVTISTTTQNTAAEVDPNRSEVIDQADAYQQEGPLTTFFAFAEGRQTVDSWSRRLASFRTKDIVSVRRSDHIEHTDDGDLDEGVVAPLRRSA